MGMDRTELASWLRLSLTPGVGNETARKLLASFGLPDTLFAQSATALRQVVSERLAQASRVGRVPAPAEAAQKPS